VPVHAIILWGGFSWYDRLNYRSLLQKIPVKKANILQKRVLSIKETVLLIKLSRRETIFYNLIDRTDRATPYASTQRQTKKGGGKVSYAEKKRF